MKYHVIWVAKYRYKVLRVQIAKRTRELIRQGCNAKGHHHFRRSFDNGS
ncbi:transposase [Lentibacillus salicampi]